MTLFFESSDARNLTEEEWVEWEREVGLRLLDYCTGVTRRALSMLSPEGRIWFKGVDLSEPDEWFDSTYPHLIVHELHRRFGQIPTARAESIDFGDGTSEALAVLFAVGGAVRSIRGMKQDQAAQFLRILDAGIRLGYTVTKAHVMPFETYAQRDVKRQEGTKKPRKPEIDKWIAEAIKRDPDATRPELWDMAPDWVIEQIGKDRFLKRVSAVRKNNCMGRK